MCVHGRARAPADCTPVPPCVRTCAPPASPMHACVRREEEEEEERRGEKGKRATGAADSLCPRKLCSSNPRLRVFSLFLSSLSLSLAPPFLLSPPSTSAPDIRVSLTLSFPRAFLLRFLSSASRRIRALLRLCHIPPSRPSAQFSRPLSPFRLCHSIAVLSRVSPTQGRPEGGMSRGPVKGARKG